MTKKEELINNIKAIEIALKYDKISIDQIAILKSYTGFGGLKCILLPIDDISQWPAYEKPLFDDMVSLYNLLKTYSKNNEEYHSFIRSLKNSVLTAFYTPKQIVEVINNQLNSAVHITKILEPSAGIGEFLNSFPKNCQSYAFEKDILTGKILKLLHPESNVLIEGFEELRPIHNNTFDAVVSNIPFGNVLVPDFGYLNKKTNKNKTKTNSCKSLHNYFFVKAIDASRDGGIIAFITSTGVMDSDSNQEARKYIMDNCNLVSATRLPSNTFQTTSVQSDLIILQKNSSKKQLSSLEKDFLTSSEVQGIKCNTLFSRPERIVHTQSTKATDLYGKPKMIYSHDQGINGIASDLEKIISNDIKSNLSLTLYTQAQAPKIQAQFDLFAPPKIQAQFDLFAPPPQEELFVGEFKDYYKANAVVLQNNEIGFISFKKNDKILFHRTLQPKKIYDIYESYILVRDAYFELYNDENQNKKENKTLRDKLNNTYDAFVSQHGTLAQNKNILTFDALSKDILAIERIFENKIIKSDIFKEPVAFAVTKTLTASEALSFSLNKVGDVNMDIISHKTNKSLEQLLLDLHGQIYFNPIDKKFETKQKFISGDVYTKFTQIRAIRDIGENPSFDKVIYDGLVALKNSFPTPIPFSLLELNLGERWIPTKIYSDFASHLFETRINIKYCNAIDQFIIDHDRMNAKIITKYGVKCKNGKKLTGLDLLGHALKDTTPDIKKNIYIDDIVKQVADNESIQLSISKINDIKSEFNKWLNLNTNLHQPIQDLYNRTYNCYVKPEFDGSHLTFSEAVFSNINIEKPYTSQSNVVTMLVSNGGGIVDHEVGTGKTLTMCLAAHEMKRLGVANKPLIIGLKANLQEVAATFQKIYPNAKILFPSEKEFAKNKREIILHNIKNNNWDCILLTHEQFGKIPQSPIIKEAIIKEELETLSKNIDVLRTDMGPMSKKALVGIERKREDLNVNLKLEMLKIEQKSDNAIDFKDMAIDHIFVDESHEFKNLTFTTSHNRVAGLGNPKGAQKALSLLTAIRTIQSNSGKDLGATFLSGTTISNSLTELYLLFKYLRPNELKKQKLDCFDAWAAVYTKKTIDFEFSVTNELRQKERFRFFIKAPELAAFYGEITDFKTAAIIGIERPHLNEKLLVLEQSPEQVDFCERLKIFAKDGDATKLGKEPLAHDNSKMLIATDLARKVALDIRIIDPELPDHINSKAHQSALNIANLYTNTTQHKGTQIVFLDLSTYAPNKWNMYSDIKDKLVNIYGIPSSEIRFIQECKTRQEKEQMLEKVNNGDIRIIFGSTKTLGTGVNIQKRIIALHHLDIPWKPSEMAQRNGRGARKGNEVAVHYNNEVKSFVYAVKNSLDNYKLNLLHNKQSFIDQIKSNSLNVRRIDEGTSDESTGISYSEYVALLSGNTNLLEKAKVEKEIFILENEKNTFIKYKIETTQSLDESKLTLDKYTKYLNAFQNDLNTIKDLKDPQLKLYSKSDINIGLNLINIAKTLDTNGVAKIIGEYATFKIVVKTENIISLDSDTKKVNKFSLQNGTGISYAHNNGYLALSDPKMAQDFFPKALEKIPSLIKDYTNKIEKEKENIKTFTEIIEKKWEKGDKLKELRTLVKQIDDKIHKSTKTKISY